MENSQHITATRVLRSLKNRTYSQTTSVVLRRDLERPLAAPKAKIPITVRRMEAREMPRVLALVSALPGYARTSREIFLNERLGIVYVAVTEDGELCYVQWLVGPAEAPRLARHTTLPVPGTREAVVEGCLIPDSFQGKGIMAAAMARVAEHAVDLGARWVLTLVNEQNVPSLRGCLKAGFEPYQIKRDRWMMMHHSIRYDPLPRGYTLPLGDG